MEQNNVPGLLRTAEEDDILLDLPESVVFHWYLPGSSTHVLSTAVSSAIVSALRLVCLPLFRLIQFRLPVFRLLHKYWKFQVCCHTHKWQMCTWTGLSTNILIC